MDGNFRGLRPPFPPSLSRESPGRGYPRLPLVPSYPAEPRGRSRGGGGLGDLGGSVVEPSAENWGAHGSPAKNGDFMWKAGDLWWVNIGRTRKKSGEIHQLKGYNTSTEILLHACLQCGWTTSEKPSMILRHVRLVLQNDHATSCPDLGILKSTWKVCVAGWWFQTYFYFPEYMG